jgi:predicted nicotinamide N-methyase
MPFRRRNLAVTWPSAAALSQWIAANPTIGEECNHILELGAGCGLVGIFSACIRKSCQASCDRRLSPQRTDPQIVTLTDFNPLVLRNLERNVALNGVSEHCRVVGLDFNDQSKVPMHGGWTDMNGNIHPPVDLILAADIICQAEDAFGAAMLIRNALRPEGRAVVVCADSAARFGVDHFLPACETLGLQVHTTPVRESHSHASTSTNLRKTSGYVDGMKLNMFQITRP